MAITPRHIVAKNPTNPEKQEKNERVHFEKEGDKARASDFSMHLLDELRRDAGLTVIIVTSAVRTEEEQASAMYENELTRKLHHDKAEKQKPFFDSESETVQVINRLGRLNGGSTDMVSKSELNNLPHHKQMAYHLKKEKANDVPYKSELGSEVKKLARDDVSAEKSDRARTEEEMSIKLKKGGLINVTRHAGVKDLEVFDISIEAMTPKQQDKFKAAVKTRFGSSIYRFGYPNAPKGVYTFNDKVFHIEIMQPKKNDAPANKNVQATA